MKTFIFYQKNSNGVLAISDTNFEESLYHLKDIVIDPEGWRCDDEDGIDED